MDCPVSEVAPSGHRAALVNEGLLPPADIKALRKRVGLTQPQVEQLLGAGLKTVTRWEKGAVIQNGAADTLLRLLRDVPEALTYLLRARQVVPKVVPKVVPRTPAASPLHH